MSSILEQIDWNIFATCHNACAQVSWEHFIQRSVYYTRRLIMDFEQNAYKCCTHTTFGIYLWPWLCKSLTTFDKCLSLVVQLSFLFIMSISVHCASYSSSKMTTFNTIGYRVNDLLKKQPSTEQMCVKCAFLRGLSSLRGSSTCLMTSTWLLHDYFYMTYGIYPFRSKDALWKKIY